MLQSLGSQSAGHEGVTEQPQQQRTAVLFYLRDSLVAQMVKNLLAMQETWV